MAHGLALSPDADRPHASRSSDLLPGEPPVLARVRYARVRAHGRAPQRHGGLSVLTLPWKPSKRL